jgi:hypothetical protein
MKATNKPAKTNRRVRLLTAACGTTRGDAPARRSRAVRVVTFFRCGATLGFGAVRATEIERAIRSPPRREDVLTYYEDSFLVQQPMVLIPLEPIEQFAGRHIRMEADSDIHSRQWHVV